MPKEYMPECPCGSGLSAMLERDARGIPLGYTCPVCRERKLSVYRPDVLTDPNYWTDEPVESD